MMAVFGMITRTGREDCGEEQDDDQRVSELAQHAACEPDAPPHRDRVRAVEHQPVGGLRSGQAGPRTHWPRDRGARRGSAAPALAPAAHDPS